MFFYLKDNRKTLTQTLLNILIKNNEKLIDIDNDISKYELDIIKEQEITSEIEAMILTDEYIEKYDTVKNGLNNKYYIIEYLKHMIDEKQKMLIYLSIQKEIIKNEYIDPLEDYNNIIAIVYQVKNGSNQKSYIGFTKNSGITLKNKLIYDYDSVINKLLNNKSLDKYDKLLGSVRFKELEIRLLEKQEKKTKAKWMPENKAEEYIKKYKTNYAEGYNTCLIKKD